MAINPRKVSWKDRIFKKLLPDAIFAASACLRT